MLRTAPILTLSSTSFPYTTLFRSPERGGARARVVGEDAVAAGVVLALHANKTQCIESSRVEQRHPLVVAVLRAWILAVTNEHDPLLHIDVAPADTADRKSVV